MARTPKKRTPKATVQNSNPLPVPVWIGLVTNEVPLPEYRFTVGSEWGHRRWLFDWAWPSRRLAVELEGGIWVQGRHTRGKGYEGDCEKYSVAALLGWRVLRFTPGMVQSGLALSLLQAAFR